jgi:hypothetical protein
MSESVGITGRLLSALLWFLLAKIEEERGFLYLLIDTVRVRVCAVYCIAVLCATRVVMAVQKGKSTG